jgi:hypothetical protein
MAEATDNPKKDSPDQPAWLNVVQQKVETLRFGIVQIVVHDSRVVQIDRTEKTRLDGPCSC